MVSGGDYGIKENVLLLFLTINTSEHFLPDDSNEPVKGARKTSLEKVTEDEIQRPVIRRGGDSVEERESDGWNSRLGLGMEDEVVWSNGFYFFQQCVRQTHQLKIKVNK